MDWLAVNPQFHGTFAQLGAQIGDTYLVNEDCLATLCDILAKLTIEDRTLRTYRRAIGFAQVVKKDLLPLLVGVRDDAKIVDVTIKILLNLTVPVECLLPMEVMLKTDVGRYTVMELNMLLSTSKEAFVSPQSTRPVVDHIKTILEKETKLTQEDCESISNCLLLLRNILHIPEHRPGSAIVSMQNQILWNLFAQNVDKVLIQLMTSKYQAYWGVTMVQLIALMYKDQQVGTLQKLLNLWFESSLSDSSEGNESNTSPQHQASGDSSSLMTSDPTSDSSDNGGSNKKRNPYQAGDSKCMNNESDDSQSSETAMSASPAPDALASTSQGDSMDSNHQSQPQARLIAHPPMGKIRVKSLSELQIRNRRIEKHTDTESGFVEDSLSSSAGHSGTWSRHSMVKPTHTQGQPHETFGHGKHHNHSQDSYGKSQEGKHKDTHPKLHQLHGPNHTGANQTKTQGKKGETGSEVSDCGYGTQQENQESNSTSSNEEDAPQRCVKHQKPQHMLQKSRYTNGKPNITPQERKELHRKKLVKRSHTKTMHMKALLHHVPSDEDISNLLKEFTVDFLLRGYACLVKVLHNCLLDGGSVQMDTSHFFWLVTYFLKFATQLELDLEHISSVLTIDIVSYLTYEGVNLYEELQMSIQCSGRDLKPCLRRMHLVVTSIREFIQAVEAYSKISHLTEEDRSHLLKLQLQIAEVHDLRGLFVLLLRHYNPSLQSQQFLQDLVVTNHNLLMFVENTIKLPEYHANFNLVEHIKQFGTVEVMHNYGLLLEDFLNNGEFVNDCILTMMHHVAGDLSQVSVLFQPLILRSLSGIWESDCELCDDWSDLIEYVLHKFVKNPSCSKVSTTSKHSEGRQISPISEGNKTEWTKEDSNNLYWYHQQCSGCEDPIEAIMNMYENNGVHDKTRISVIQQLLQQDVINEHQYGSYMERETLLAISEKQHSSVYSTQKSAKLENAARGETEEQFDQNEGESMEEDFEPANDIKVLKDQLESEGHGKMIQWLQEQLLEVCYVKISLERDLPIVKEPIAHIYTRLCQSTPLVPWYVEQEQCLHCPAFILLLHKLGLHLAGDAGKLFPRVPHFWETDVLFQTAEKLGPISKENVKFDLNLLRSRGAAKTQRLTSSPPTSLRIDLTSSNTSGNSFTERSLFALPSASKTSLSWSRYTPEPVMSNVPNWLQVVQQSKATRLTSTVETTNSPIGSKSNRSNQDTIDKDSSIGIKRATASDSVDRQGVSQEQSDMDVSS
ncbi:protein timeless isoform X2 [Frankliniella occidentalis]|uniref:Protein timeless isoform X2 n=1 Tax=Frankliniella occidentalis TaxID=133901 RepID=A0A6J1SR24_FRAOC|nr:protein timeless isoform X2 [Frankliniella occidentalis]